MAIIRPLLINSNNSRVNEKIMVDYTLYLFNSLGDWIATQADRDVYSIDNKWIGWVRNRDMMVFTGDNEYIGTIVHGNRLYYFEDHPSMNMSSPWFVLPPLLEVPEFPGHETKDDLPEGARDVNLKNG